LKYGLGKGWKDQLDRSRDKLRSITLSQGGEKYRTYEYTETARD